MLHQTSFSIMQQSVTRCHQMFEMIAKCTKLSQLIKITPHRMLKLTNTVYLYARQMAVLYCTMRGDHRRRLEANNIKAPKEDRVVRIKIHSHQVHSPTLQ